VFWVQPAVASVVCRLKLSPPREVTVAVNWSPGRTGLEQSSDGPGYISYQAQYCGVRPGQSTSLPVCSTVLLL
jgi:hypothetical protein